MARRFARISTLGQCTVILDGVAYDPPRRARLVQQTASGWIFLVAHDDQGTQMLHVTELQTEMLLDRLAEYAWQAPFWLSDDDSPEPAETESRG